MCDAEIGIAPQRKTAFSADSQSYAKEDGKEERVRKGPHELKLPNNRFSSLEVRTSICFECKPPTNGRVYSFRSKGDRFIFFMNA